jgi:hypothetical protein
MGFFLGNDAVATCAHVVRDALGLKELPAAPPPGDVLLDFPYSADRAMLLKAEAQGWDKEKDVAVLRLKERPPSDAEPAVLYLGDTETLRNHPVRVLGAPEGYDDDLVESTADWKIKTALPNGNVQLAGDKTTDIRIQPGFSGTPVFDEEIRKVVGMICAIELNHDARVSFMIPAAALLKKYPIHEEGEQYDYCPFSIEVLLKCLEESFSGLDNQQIYALMFSKPDEKKYADHIRHRRLVDQRMKEDCFLGYSILDIIKVLDPCLQENFYNMDYTDAKEKVYEKLIMRRNYYISDLKQKKRLRKC